MRLYYPKNYLEKDKYKKCLKDNEVLGVANSKNFCLKNFNINQIIVGLNDKIDEKYYQCDLLNADLSSRNFFNKKIQTYKYCKKINLSE